MRVEAGGGRPVLNPASPLASPVSAGGEPGAGGRDGVGPAVPPPPRKHWAARTLDHPLTAAVLTLFTTYSLFCDDTRLAAFDSRADGVFLILSSITVALFTVEMGLQAIGRDGYAPMPEFVAACWRDGHGATSGGGGGGKDASTLAVASPVGAGSATARHHRRGSGSGGGDSGRKRGSRGDSATMSPAMAAEGGAGGGVITPQQPPLHGARAAAGSLFRAACGCCRGGGCGGCGHGGGPAPPPVALGVGVVLDGSTILRADSARGGRSVLAAAESVTEGGGAGGSMVSVASSRTSRPRDGGVAIQCMRLVQCTTCGCGRGGDRGTTASRCVSCSAACAGANRAWRFISIGSFYLWLDAIAIIAMALEVTTIAGGQVGVSTGESSSTDAGISIARAGRVSRAGVRVGRLLRIAIALRTVVWFTRMWLACAWCRRDGLASAPAHGDGAGGQGKGQASGLSMDGTAMAARRLAQSTTGTSSFALAARQPSPALAHTSGVKTPASAVLAASTPFQPTPGVDGETRVGAHLTDLRVRRVVFGVLACVLVIPVLTRVASNTSHTYAAATLHSLAVQAAALNATACFTSSPSTTACIGPWRYNGVFAPTSLAAPPLLRGLEQEALFPLNNVVVNMSLPLDRAVVDVKAFQPELVYASFNGSDGVLRVSGKVTHLWPSDFPPPDAPPPSVTNATVSLSALTHALYLRPAELDQLTLWSGVGLAIVSAPGCSAPVTWNATAQPSLPNYDVSFNAFSAGVAMNATASPWLAGVMHWEGATTITAPCAWLGGPASASPAAAAMTVVPVSLWPVSGGTGLLATMVQVVTMGGGMVTLTPTGTTAVGNMTATLPNTLTAVFVLPGPGCWLAPGGSDTLPTACNMTVRAGLQAAVAPAAPGAPAPNDAAIWASSPAAAPLFTSTIVFSRHADIALAAQWDIGLTLLVILVLAMGAGLFSYDINRIVLTPLERMVQIVRQLSANPLMPYRRPAHPSPSGGRAVDTEAADRGDGGKDEEGVTVGGDNVEEEVARIGGSAEMTVLLRTLLNIGSLLRMGFGSPGAAMLMRNLNARQELNPIIPAHKGQAIFLCVVYRRFDEVMSEMGEDGLVYVNLLSDVIHTCVAAYGGQVCRNFHGGTLAVWPLPSGEDALTSPLLPTVALGADATSSVGRVGGGGGPPPSTAGPGGVWARARALGRDIPLHSQPLTHVSMAADAAAMCALSIMYHLAAASAHLGGGGGAAEEGEGGAVLPPLATACVEAWARVFNPTPSGAGATDIGTGAPVDGAGVETGGTRPAEGTGSPGRPVDAAMRPGRPAVATPAPLAPAPPTAHAPPAVRLDRSVAMSVHAGWALDGPIGSDRKLEATYMSPHIATARHLCTLAEEYVEAATGEGGGGDRDCVAPIALSHVVYACMSPQARAAAVWCDRVAFAPGRLGALAPYRQPWAVPGPVPSVDEGAKRARELRHRKRRPGAGAAGMGGVGVSRDDSRARVSSYASGVSGAVAMPWTRSSLTLHGSGGDETEGDGGRNRVDSRLIEGDDDDDEGNEGEDGDDGVEEEGVTWCTYHDRPFSQLTGEGRRIRFRRPAPAAALGGEEGVVDGGGRSGRAVRVVLMEGDDDDDCCAASGWGYDSDGGEGSGGTSAPPVTVAEWSAVQLAYLATTTQTWPDDVTSSTPGRMCTQGVVDVYTLPLAARVLTCIAARDLVTAPSTISLFRPPAAAVSGLLRCGAMGVGGGGGMASHMHSPALRARFAPPLSAPSNDGTSPLTAGTSAVAGRQPMGGVLASGVGSGVGAPTAMPGAAMRVAPPSPPAPHGARPGVTASALSGAPSAPTIDSCPPPTLTLPASHLLSLPPLVPVHPYVPAVWQCHPTLSVLEAGGVVAQRLAIHRAMRHVWMGIGRPIPTVRQAMADALAQLSSLPASPYAGLQAHGGGDGAGGDELVDLGDQGGTGRSTRWSLMVGARVVRVHGLPGW